MPFKILHMNMKYLIFKRYVLVNLKKIIVLLKSTAYSTDDNMVYLTCDEGEVIQIKIIVEHVTFILLRLL